MQVISVKELLLRHNNNIISVNIGQLEEALKNLISEIGPTGENLAFITKENTFQHRQHIQTDNLDGTFSTLTIDPQQIVASESLDINAPSLTRSPLPEVYSENEIATMKEVQDVQNDLENRTQYATETRTGVVQLATQEEANAFEDDQHVLTPKKLKPVDDRLIYLETKPNYIIDTAFPDDFVGNTIYALVDSTTVS